jgi:hypothetical protein
LRELKCAQTKAIASRADDDRRAADGMEKQGEMVLNELLTSLSILDVLTATDGGSRPAASTEKQEEAT